MLQSFLWSFLLLLVLAGCAVVGFYIITRKGKIFKSWSAFWEQTTGEFAKVYLIDQELEDKYAYLVHCNANMANLLGVNPQKTFLTLKGEIDAWQQQYINDVLGCRSTLVLGETGHMVLYTEQPVYYFPEWVRYPLSQCPPCMASVGGTLIYWPVILLQKDVFSWTDYTWQPYILFWVFFCTALSFLNKFLYSLVGS